MVERIEDVSSEAIRLSAGRLHVAIGERILPLAGCDEPPGQAIRILRLSDDVSEIAYGFGEVIDLVTLGAELRPAPSPGEVSGVTLLGGFPMPITTPAHGTAYDIAGKGVANIGASRNAVLLAARMGREPAAKAGTLPRTSLADARRALSLSAVPQAA